MQQSYRFLGKVGNWNLGVKNEWMKFFLDLHYSLWICLVSFLLLLVGHVVNKSKIIVL